MSKVDFANLIVSKLKTAIGSDGGAFSSSTSESAQLAIAEAITEYITANVTIAIAYNGTMISSGTSDAVVYDTMKVTGSCLTTGTPSDYSFWVSSLQQNIASGFTVLTPGEHGVVTNFMPFSNVVNALKIPQEDLKAMHEQSFQNPMQAIWECICEHILNWLNSAAAMNPTVGIVVASRPGISSGTATFTSIIAV